MVEKRRSHRLTPTATATFGAAAFQPPIQPQPPAGRDAAPMPNPAEEFTLVLLHGFMGCGGDWEPVVGHLRGLVPHWNILTPDLPGHGSRTGLRERDYAFDEMVARVVDLVSDRRGSRVGIAGYSMGGRIALGAAVCEPDLFESVVLLSAAPGIADVTRRLERRRTDAMLAARMEALETHDAFREFLEEWWRQPVFHGLPNALRDALVERRLTQSPQELARALRGAGAGSQPSFLEKLAAFPGRVLAVAGARDRKFQAIAETIAGAVPRGAPLVVPAAGHILHLEVPKAVASLIVRFTGFPNPPDTV